jgi:hypothetical protein
MSVELQEPLMAAPADDGSPPEPPVEKLPSHLKPPTKWEERNYNFEYYFTTDPNAKPVVVIIANLICVTILTILFYLTNNLHQLSGVHRFLEMFYMSLAKMGAGGGAGPNGWLWPTRAILILSGFMKMGAFSLLVNFLGDALDSKMEAIFEGASKVLEENFVLILGWSDKILPLVDQLCLANESDGGGPIVIMSEMYKPDMDAFLLDNIEEWRGSKLVTRGGNPINPNNLEFVAAPIARSIVVLSQGFDPDEADAQAARAVLAVTGGMKHQPTGHVVVELRDADNVPVVRLGISDAMCPTQEEKDRRVLPCVGPNLVGRLMVQCSFEPGLARVFDHILAFEYNEFYFSNWDAQLSGKKFADACFSFEDAVCIGICTPELDADGRRIFLNPPGDTIINGGDLLIFVAEDNDTYTCGEVRLSATGKPPDVKEAEKKGNRTLLIGWRRDMQEMVLEVDKWAQPGSNLTILAPGSEDEGYCPAGPTIDERIAELKDADCDPDALTNIVLVNVEGSPLLRDTLQNKCEVHTFDSVLILTPEAEGVEGIRCDSRSMVTMLLCRDIQKKMNSFDLCGGRDPFLVAEILDPRTANLLKLASANDFMVSNLLISECLGQMSQEINIQALLEDLFCPEGNEMHIKPINLYAYPGEALTFWELVARARMRCEIALGYICANDGNELILNPLNKDAPIQWDMASDRVVVISED